MKSRTLLISALLTLVLVFSLVPPAAVAGTPSTTVSTVDDHSGVDSSGFAIPMALGGSYSAGGGEHGISGGAGARDSATTDDIDTECITLVEGWNLISLPVVPEGNDIADVLADISENVVMVRHYDGATDTWLWHIPATGAGELTTLEDGSGYWIFMDAPDTLCVVVQQLPVPPAYQVVEGWNLIGFTSTTPMHHSEYLSDLYTDGEPDYLVIWGYDTDTGTYVRVYPMGTDDLEQGYGYWLWATGDGTIVPPGQPVLRPETVVVDEETEDVLTSVTEDQDVLTFGASTPLLDALEPGDVIVMGVTDHTPYGLLRRVTGITNNDAQVIVETEFATLEDAIEECDISETWSLLPDGSAVPLGMVATSTCTGWYIDIDVIINDEVTVSGSLCMNIDLNVRLDIHKWSLREAHFSVSVTTSESAQLDLELKAALAEFSFKRELFRKYLNPIVVWAGFVPIVITPVLTFNMGVDGEVYAGVATSITWGAKVTVGVNYRRSAPSLIASNSASFGWERPSLTAGGEVKAYVGPQFSLLLYGVTGPYGEIRGYGKLEADILATPWWSLYGGVEAAVGFRVEILGHHMADYEVPAAIGYRVLLAQAETDTPVTLTISSTAGGSVTTPGEGTFFYDSATAVNLVAEAEAGYRFVNWTGDVDTIANPNSPATTITMEGNYSIMASFEEQTAGEYTPMVAAGGYHTVGLKSDGSVVAVGRNNHGQCDVGGWTGIAQVAADYMHTVGLKSDGSVVAVGYNADGQCNVAGWTGIAQVAAGGHHTVGLKSDGTMVAVGANYRGQCNVSALTDIVQVAAGKYHTVGLKSDGSVVAVGYNGFGQCNVSAWTDIVQVAPGGLHTVGLKSDGSVVAVGYNDYGQCNVAGWTGIVQVASCDSHTVGLKSDGSVVAVGYNYYGQCNVGDWNLS